MTILEKIKFEEDWLSEVNLTKENIKIAFAGIRATALEQQPSKDCISRQAVLDIINFEDEWLFDAKSHNADTKIAFSGLESRVKALPSVTPKYTDEEIDRAQAVEQAYVDKMVELTVEEWRKDGRK